MKRNGKELSRLTRKRLYAYPQLKANIEQYKLNIEDIKREEFGKSKSVVMFQSRSAEPPTVEEMREAYIAKEEAKILRDEAEIKEMDRALSLIKCDALYKVIPMTFFELKDEEKICEELHTSKMTVYRAKGRLIDRLNIVLYGAEAIGI